MTDTFEYTTEIRYTLAGITFSKTSEWEGLEKWVDDQGRTLIVKREGQTGFAAAFAGMLGESSRPAVRVVAASPDIAAVLRLSETADPLSKERHCLKQIREAGYNEHPTALWMQKVAAHALEPQKFPHPGKQPVVAEVRGCCMTACPKCRYTSGNDWRQCAGRCPMPGSPCYDPTWPAGSAASIGKWQPLETRPTAEGVSFLVRLPVNDTATSVALQVSNFEGQMYPDHLGYNIDWGDRVTTATAWASLPEDAR